MSMMWIDVSTFITLDAACVPLMCYDDFDITQQKYIIGITKVDKKHRGKKRRIFRIQSSE